MASVPSTPMIHDNCDYCLRDFGWTDKAICTNCGLENVRKRPPVPSVNLRETAMISPAIEQAVMPPAQNRKPATKTSDVRRRKKGRTR